ncbi:MAG: permease-like cell division protein FtsX [Flavobacteriales bacterium]|nr:permease-like cell division protein FtsX [Flavobacteriales bacterium]
MSTPEQKINNKRLRSSYFSNIVSISLVLFILGLLGLILLTANKMSIYVKENIGFSVYIKEHVKEVDIIKIKKSLDAKSFVKKTKYVDKEEAAEKLQENLGEDFTNWLGYNPLLSSVDVYLLADYAHPDSLSWIEADLMKDNKIKEVYYEPDLLQLVNENVRKIGFILIGFSVLLMIIAIALINSSIRLAIYSKRFVIRTMQLVGATKGFIKRPFIWKGIVQGVVGALISTLLILGVIYFGQQEFPEVFHFQDLELLGTLFSIILLFGILITWFSTSLAINKYLRIRPDKLY